MMDVMVHRGPDDCGMFEVPGVGLGHRRLSIIDLSGGHQPMVLEGGRAAIVFNGEIYNYRELRAELEAQGDTFLTASDTEVLLRMYLRHGESMLDRLNGMFAFVIYDAAADTLFGARDRLGIKPFYYSESDGEFLFASEIKALLQSGRVPARANPMGLDLYFAYRYVPDAHTCYAGVRKLLPGHAFRQVGDGKARIWRYWGLPDDGIDLPFDEAVARFEELLTDAVRYRLISDVPLGAFLSGGVDSTSIVAAMSLLGHRPIRAFTVGFDADIDETAEAAVSARYYDCEHTRCKVPPDGLEWFEKTIWHMDEPFGDPILIPTYLLSREASKTVKVILTGEGADEGQMGYVHHESLAKGFALADHIPRLLLACMAGVAAHVPVCALDWLFRYPDSMGTEGRARFARLCRHLGQPGSAYQLSTSLFTLEDRRRLYGPRMLAGLEEAESEYYEPLIRALDEARDPLQAIYRHDMTHWLPDNILNKQDRMTMASSIEGRVPFLDHRLIEFLVRLPHAHKMHGGKGKHLLGTLFDRRYTYPGRQQKQKQAFYMPLTRRYQASYRELVEKHLTPNRIDDRLLNRSEVRRVVESAERSSLVGHKKVMSLISFQIWQDTFEPTWA